MGKNILMSLVVKDFLNTTQRAVTRKKKINKFSNVKLMAVILPSSKIPFNKITGHRLVEAICDTHTAREQLLVTLWMKRMKHRENPIKTNKSLYTNISHMRKPNYQ